MTHLVYQVQCPGCGRQIRALSEDARRERVLRHVRNCRALAFGRSDQVVSADQFSERHLKPISQEINQLSDVVPFTEPDAAP